MFDSDSHIHRLIYATCVNESSHGNIKQAETRMKPVSPARGEQLRISKGETCLNFLLHCTTTTSPDDTICPHYTLVRITVDSRAPNTSVSYTLAPSLHSDNHVHFSSSASTASYKDASTCSSISHHAHTYLQGRLQCEDNVYA